MSATFRQIRQALAARLQAITVDGKDMHTYDHVPAQVNFPAAVVEGFERGRRATMEGSWVWDVPIVIYAARGTERGAQELLDGIASPGAGGIWQALEDDTVNDVCDYVMILELRDYGEYEAHGIQLLGFEALVEVCA